ncbi:MAG: hypothetical protein AAF436_19105 [Myxococcota bacterium]
MMKPRYMVLLAVISTVACNKVSMSRTSPTKFPAKEGPATIIWDDQARGIDPSSYEVIGTGQKGGALCGKQAMADTEKHQALAREASAIGADAVFLSCGTPGTTGECWCTGRAVRWTAGAPGVGITCEPGETQRCVGAGACEGAQACVPDGTSWGPCQC